MAASAFFPTERLPAWDGQKHLMHKLRSRIPDSDPGIREIPSDDFAWRFSLRAANLMWFLGAGASVVAGIPTAWDMVWEFKQKLFLTQRRVPLSTITDLSNPEIRKQLHAHVDSLGPVNTNYDRLRV